MTDLSEMQMPVDYSKQETPAGYCCCKCGLSGVKLWRKYQTMLDDQNLLCRACTIAEQGSVAISQSESAIGWRIAAVPTEEGNTFWGYTSVPQAGCEWWYGLPAQPTP